MEPSKQNNKFIINQIFSSLGMIKLGISFQKTIREEFTYMDLEERHQQTGSACNASICREEMGTPTADSSTTAPPTGLEGEQDFISKQSCRNDQLSSIDATTDLIHVFK